MDLSDVQQEIEALSNQVLETDSLAQQNTEGIVSISNQLEVISTAVDDNRDVFDEYFVQSSNLLFGLSNDLDELTLVVTECCADLEGLSNFVGSNLDEIFVDVEALGDLVQTNTQDIAALSNEITAIEIPDSFSNATIEELVITSNITILDDNGLTIGGYNLTQILDATRYSHPSNIELNRLAVNEITNDTYFPPDISLNASLTPSGIPDGFPGFHQVGNPASRFLEGHFVSIYADNLFAGTPGSNVRRVLLEGDVVDSDLPSWVDQSQSNVSLSGFQNDLALADVAFSGSYLDLDDRPGNIALPPWVQPLQNAVTLSGFSGQLDYIRINGTPDIPFVPAWVTAALDQDDLLLSGFTNDLPSASVPSWVTDPQNTVNISGFNLDVDFTGPQGPPGADSTVPGPQGEPGPPGTTSWLGLSDRPGWVTDPQSTVSLSGFNNDLPSVAVPSWVTDPQSTVNISGFNLDVDFTGPQGPPGADSTVPGPQGEPGPPGTTSWLGLSDRPSWVTDPQSTVSLSGFNNDLPSVAVPSWVTDPQSTVNISGFNLDVDFTGPQGPPGADSTVPGPQGEPGPPGTTSWLGLSDRPSWVTDPQSSVSLSGFNNDLSLAADWNTLANRPSWTDKFTYFQNVGPAIDPPESTNFDIVAFDSVTPTGNNIFNLGQNALRWRFVYSVFARISDRLDFLTDNSVSLQPSPGNLSLNARFTAPNMTVLLPPTQSSDVATKGYVDSQTSSPTWETISGSQSSVQLSGFGGSLDISRITNAPVIPSWVQPSQGSVQLSAFGGNLDYSRLNNAVQWANLPGRPAWTNFIEYGSLPGQTVGVGDLLFKDSLVPETNFSYNLGQSSLRFLNTFTGNLFTDSVATTALNATGQSTLQNVSAGAVICSSLSTPSAAVSTTLTVSGTINSDIRPASTDTYRLGTSSRRWNEVHGKTIFWNKLKKVSDERLKENIQVYDGDCLGALCGMTVKSYNYIGDSDPNIGLIAQDLIGTPAEIMVTQDEDGYYGIDYDLGMGCLTRSVQQLCMMVEGIDARLSTLEASLSN